MLVCVSVGGSESGGKKVKERGDKMGHVNGDVRRGAVPLGLISYCCPDDLGLAAIETFLP